MTSERRAVGHVRPWAAIAAAVLVAVAACESPPDTPVAAENLMAVGADALVFGMENYLTTDGVRTGVVRADSAYQFNDSSVNHLFGVDMTLFNDQGEPRAHLTSETGVLQQRSEQMVARGNVVLTVQEQGVIVETSELHYDPQGERIWSDSVSTLRRRGQTQRGTCCQSDLQYPNVSVCQPVGDIIGREGMGGGSGGAGPRNPGNDR